MNKTIAELRKYFEELNVPKNGEIVSVLNPSTKKYEKAVVLSEHPTKETEISKYVLSHKVGDKKEKIVCAITAIHSGKLVGQLAR